MAQPKLKAADEPEAPSERTPAKSLAAALLEAQRAIGAVGKTSMNEYDRYAYVSADSMVAACREALHGAGLVFHREGYELDRAVDPPELISRFVLEFPETAERREFLFPWPIVGNQKRLYAHDKSRAGALTTSQAYFLRDLLSVPRADANEMERREDPEREPTAKPSDESRTLQAEIAAKVGLLKSDKFIKITNEALTRAGHDLKLLRQTSAWLDRRIAEEKAAAAGSTYDPAPGESAAARPKEPTLVDPETGEVLEPDMDPEDPRFGLGKGEDGP